MGIFARKIVLIYTIGLWVVGDRLESEPQVSNEGLQYFKQGRSRMFTEFIFRNGFYLKEDIIRQDQQDN
jgi:hypothetical protein